MGEDISYGELIDRQGLSVGDWAILPDGQRAQIDAIWPSDGDDADNRDADNLSFGDAGTYFRDEVRATVERKFIVQRQVEVIYEATLTESQVREFFPEIIWDDDLGQASQIEDLMSEPGGIPDEVYDLLSVVASSHQTNPRCWEE